MKKREELSDSQSCLSKASDDEEIFVLLGRDPSACFAVISWCSDRIKRGINKPDDPKIVSALQWAAKVMH